MEKNGCYEQKRHSENQNSRFIPKNWKTAAVYTDLAACLVLVDIRGSRVDNRASLSATTPLSDCLSPAESR